MPDLKTLFDQRATEPLDRRILLGVGMRKMYDHSTFGESFHTGSRAGTMVRDSKSLRLAMAIASGIILITAGMSHSDEPDKCKSLVTAREAFARLKGLVGTWDNDVSSTKPMKHDVGGKVVYRLTGADSALVETDFPSSHHEMMSVYHLDGDELRMTHYCAAGNQPRLRLDRASSTPSRLVFVFDGGSNLDPAKDMHIHGMTLTFEKDGVVKAAWEAYAEGRPAGTTTFHLTPQKP